MVVFLSIVQIEVTLCRLIRRAAVVIVVLLAIAMDGMIESSWYLTATAVPTDIDRLFFLDSCTLKKFNKALRVAKKLSETGAFISLFSQSLSRSRKRDGVGWMLCL